MTTARIKRRFLADIDLTKMSKEERVAVGCYLDKQKDNAVIKKNSRCTIDVPSGKEIIRYSFGINNKLFHDVEGATFDVQDRIAIGRGSFGSVKPLLGKLAKKKNGEAYFIPSLKNEPRLVKKIKQQKKEVEADFLAGINREYDLAGKTPHLLFEPLIDVTDPKNKWRHSAYIRMPYFIGNNLESLLQYGIDDSNVIIEICLNAALSLQMMFHDRGIVHRDIKPGNMTVTRSDQVAIYDVGLAKGVDEEVDYEYAGTLFYMSPEQINQEKTTPATDVYALGKTFARLLKLINDTLLDENEKLHTKDRERLEKIILSGDATFDKTEFNKLEDISFYHKDVLFNLVQSMTRYVDKDRCNLDDVISTLDQVKLERKLTAAPKRKHNHIRMIHQKTIAERNDLRESLRQGETFRFKM